MTTHAFGDREIAAWEEAHQVRTPSPITDADINVMPDVASMASAVFNIGIGFRFRTTEGDEIDVLLNPVIARRLAFAIMTEGRHAGWLDERGEITAPLRPLDH